MSGSFTLTGKLVHHDKVTPFVNMPLQIDAATYADSGDAAVYAEGISLETDADGTFSVSLVTETDLYYTITSGSKPALFDPVTFLSPADGTTVDLSSLVTTNPGAITPSLITQAQQAAADAAASAADAAASAASIQREQANGVAGLDVAGKLFDIRIPNRLTLANAARDYVASGETAINVKHPAYGAIGDGVADDTTAVAAAVAAAKANSRSVYFPAGTYKITSNVTIDWDYATLAGAGANSVLNFVGCGLVITATTSFHFRTTLRDLRINRSGTAGPAILMIGASGSTGPARWTLDNIDVKGSTGDGIEIAGAFIGTVVGCYFRETTGRGVYMHRAGGTGNAGQCIAFLGGEIQNCVAGGVEMSDARGVAFLGTAIEGNGAFGAKLNGCSGTTFQGNYWEANANADIIVGDSTSSNGLAILGGYFLMGSAVKTKSIQLVRGLGVSIRGNNFSGFTTNSPVAVNEGSVGTVGGAAPELENYTDGSAPIVALNGAPKFNETIVGQQTTAPITKHLTGFAALDFPSIAAGGHADLTITVTGAASGDDVTLHMNTAMPDGIVLQPWVSAANTVTVRASNVVGTAIDPASVTVRARVWK